MTVKIPARSQGGRRLDLWDRVLYHQIPPLKLLTVAVTAGVSLYLV